MRIIIIGGGKVGYALASNLVTEKHDVTIVDTDEAALKKASDELDVMCIRGNGASLTVLKSSGAARADIVVAVTGRDELNMVCCLAAKKLGALHTIARIRDTDYTGDLDQFQKELDIDVVVNPESATAAQISQLLRFPGATTIDAFYRGSVELIGFRVNEGDFIAGAPLHSVMQKLRGIQVLFCAVEHDGEVIIPNGSTVLNGGDTAYVIGDMFGIGRFFRALGRIIPKMKNVIIIGGSRTAEYLARTLTEMKIDVKIIEIDPHRCLVLSEDLPRALIVCGDGTDQELLTSENVGLASAFVTLTGRDEDNLITSLYAKQAGVAKVIAKINHQNFPGVIRSLGIDSVVSPKQITAYSILKFVRGLINSQGSSMNALYRIAEGRVEAMEFTVGEDTLNLGVPLRELSSRLRPGILVAVIVRGGRFITPEGSDCIKVGDTVIIVAADSTINSLNDIFVK